MTRAECEAVLAAYVANPGTTRIAAKLAEALAATLQREGRLWEAASTVRTECEPDCRPGIRQHTGPCRDLWDTCAASAPTLPQPHSSSDG